MIKRILLFACLIIFAGCELKDNKVYYYEITVRNAGDKNIWSVTIKTGTETNMFGYMGSGAPDKGATAAGCAVSFNGDTKITWEDENEKVREFDLNLKQYYPQRNQIKGFEFIYQGNDKWKVIVKK